MAIAESAAEAVGAMAIAESPAAGPAAARRSVIVCVAMPTEPPVTGGASEAGPAGPDEEPGRS